MSEELHTSREVAAELGLGAAMLRRYASTYEAVSGDVITVHRRDGRLFTGRQLEILVKARALVMRTNTDVETALKQAPEQPVAGDAIAPAQRRVAHSMPQASCKPSQTLIRSLFSRHLKRCELCA